MPQHKAPGDAFLTLGAAGTPFLDGFSTASAGFLIALQPELTALETGLLTSLYLAGSFLGAGLLGRAADRAGRRPVFLGVPALAAVLLLLVLFSPSVALLLFVRFAVGFLLGGDYPVGQALVTECVKPENRGRSLTVLMLAWNVGAVFAILSAAPILALDLGWQAFFALQGALAVLFLLMRKGAPESAEWQSARKAVSPKAEEKPETRAPEYWRNFLFCSGFWLCQTMPATAMMFYAPAILTAMTGESDAVTHMLILYGFFFAGALPALSKGYARRPRRMLFTTFLSMAFGWAAVSFGGTSAGGVVLAGFALYAFAYGLQTPLDFIYPNQLFPAGHRAGTVGLITAVSRIGAMGSAFLFPLMLEAFGEGVLMTAGFVLLLLGILLALWGAPRDEAP